MALKRCIVEAIKGYIRERFELWMTGRQSAWCDCQYPSIERERHGVYRCDVCAGHGRFISTETYKTLDGAKVGALEALQCCPVCMGFGVPVYRLAEFKRKEAGYGLV